MTDIDDWMDTARVSITMTPREWAHVVAALRIVPSAEYKRLENIIGNAVMEAGR
jgi:hypothetical protein